MRITKQGSVYQLAFMPRLFPVNCYLVEEAEELTLIDAALPFSIKGIMMAAAQIGKPLTRIVLTHAHDDHVGALDALKEALPNVQVYISRRDAKLLGGDVRLEPEEPDTPIKGGVPKSVRTKPDVLLEDGDRIGSLKAIAVPGHTPGSMAFLDERSGALIAGDALQTRGGVAVSGKMQWRFPFPAFATWSAAQALESARKLQHLQPALLAVGHGKMIVEPAETIARAIREAENALMKARESHGRSARS
ncbi:MBL fold metallo-hydrolase [Paenibacillus allorhizosphaerae]|uniref:Hydroxyacylglutathione hydrolase n=1 Tax=Paenibacillus allorhizosphaerae TaxID=2849866 RepID=A0ABM8VPR0_9BACL|nr:MBL fold metallo-hydrolase [Paenibacillus allorhizosphaerae]CAG7653274.1 Hydroxyacylglutathione hydrolase [Paenibacillus allorhizosphaerae]